MKKGAVFKLIQLKTYSLYLQILHVRNQHCSQLNEITMGWIFDLYNTPGILPASHLFSFYFNHCISTHDSKWHGFTELLYLLFKIFVFVTEIKKNFKLCFNSKVKFVLYHNSFETYLKPLPVAFWQGINLYSMFLNFSQYSFFKLRYFLLG